MLPLTYRCSGCYVRVPDSREVETPVSRTVSFRCTALLVASSAVMASLATTMLLGSSKSGPRTGGSMEPEISVLPSFDSEIDIGLNITTEFSVRAASAAHLFGELTTEEMKAVAKFTSESLGCARGFKGLDAKALKGCFLSGSEAVSLRLPTKAAALAHLDGGSPAPPRFARAIVVHGEKPVEEGVGIYDIGPLDGRGLAKDASVSLVQSLHFNRRPVDVGDYSSNVVMARLIDRCRGLFLAVFGDIIYTLLTGKQSSDGSLYVLYAPAASSTLQRRVARALIVWLKNASNDQHCWLHPLPLDVGIVQAGSSEDWYAENITICGQYFTTVDALVAADEAGTFQRCKYQPKTAFKWDNAGPNPGTRAAHESPGPARTVPMTWHIERGAIRWRRWEMFATIRPGSGLALYDLRFRGERIMYELGQQEAHAYYSGSNAAKQLHYSDKAFSLTGLSQNMLPGLDCPHGASYLNGTTWLQVTDQVIFQDPTVGRTVALACVFESDGYEGTLWRHGMLMSDKVSGRLLKQLIVRSVTTVANYDYIAEVRFGEDGSVQVRNDFAGYPESDHMAPYMEPDTGGRRLEDSAGIDRTGGEFLDWATRVRGDLVAQFHSHFVSWKVDLDILGPRNDFHISRSTFKEEDGKTMKALVDTRVDKEDPDKLLVALATEPKLWRIVNPNQRNAETGAPRGYAVVIDSAPAVQVLPPSHPFAAAGSFAKRQIAVARRKDEEPSSTHSLDHYTIPDPLLSVDKFLADRESLVGEDLVCWVSIGKEHIIRTEDLPLISNMGVQFSLLPWNYFEENPTMSLPMMRSWRV